MQGISAHKETHKNQFTMQDKVRKRKHVMGIEGICVSQELCVEEGIGAKEVTYTEKENCVERKMS